MRNDVRSLWCWKSQKSALLARASIHVPIPQTTKLRSKLAKNNFDMLPLCYFHQLASFKGVGLAKCHADSVAPCCCIWLGWFPPWPGPGLRAFFSQVLKQPQKAEMAVPMQCHDFANFGEARIGHHKALRHHGRLHRHSTWRYYWLVWNVRLLLKEWIAPPGPPCPPMLGPPCCWSLQTEISTEKLALRNFWPEIRNRSIETVGTPTSTP